MGFESPNLKKPEYDHSRLLLATAERVRMAAKGDYEVGTNSFYRCIMKDYGINPDPKIEDFRLWRERIERVLDDLKDEEDFARQRKAEERKQDMKDAASHAGAIDTHVKD